MRTITYFSEKPEEREVKVVGKIANIYIRTDIEETKGEERLEWKAVEYWSQTPYYKDFKLTDELCEKIIAKDSALEASRIRQKRDALLEASDKEILPDRLTKTSAAFKAWSDYREALRNIPQQKGFPWNVEFPAPPK